MPWNYRRRQHREFRRENQHLRYLPAKSCRGFLIESSYFRVGDCDDRFMFAYTNLFDYSALRGGANAMDRSKLRNVGFAAVFGIIVVLLMGCATPKDSGQAVYVDAETRAVEGYDTVAYFSLEPEAEAVAGDNRFSLRWKGATWLFVSDAHRATFEAAPERYAPAFGGYCSMAMAQGKRVAADPNVWTIHDGQLYLFARNAGRTDWLEDPQRYIADAEANWTAIRAKLIAE